MRHGNSFDWLDWLIETTVKIAVGVSVGVVLGLLYLFKALLPDSLAARVESMAGESGGSSSYGKEQDLHQARNRDRVDTRINKPRNQDSGRQDTPFRIRKTPNVHTGWIRTIFGGSWAAIGMIGLAMQAPPLIMAVLFLAPGLWSLYSGITARKNNRRYAAHLKRIGERETISREELAAIVGCSDAQAEKDLRKMAASGFLGQTAYYNDQYERLFVSQEAERAWLAQNPVWESMRQEETKAPPKEAEEGYSGILRQLRRSGDAIRDPDLRAKVDRLYDLTARIFKAVEDDPSKEKQIDTLLSYYLPTTQKLLDSYVQFESAGVEGENVTASKARISETMDMVLKGFSRQLDQLYKADAMDIDSDIRVMETMLRRDTGSVSDDFGFGGSAVQWQTDEE